MTNPSRTLTRMFSVPAFIAAALLIAAITAVPSIASADAKDAKASPDVIVFNNGDQLSGKFVRAIEGSVVFHSDIAGDITVGLDKVKEIRSANKFAVFEKGQHVTKTPLTDVPQGAITIDNQQIAVNTGNGQTKTIAVKNAQYVIDQQTFEDQIRHEPGILHGWAGAATAGASLVKATDNTTTFNGSIALLRTVPVVSWLNTRNKTSIDFNGSYGKITTPAYTVGGVLFPSTFAKTAIYHAAAERDEYLSPRFFVLAQTAFDHNYSQGLDLQQIYGAGVGWTAIKHPRQTLDLKATMQYEKQQFLSSGAGSNQNLIGSTFSATYLLKVTKTILLDQQAAFIPAYNNSRAYSGNETTTLTFPVYKRLGFSVATIDSYLNDPPATEPPTKRNSFQFTTGVTYTLGPQ